MGIILSFRDLDVYALARAEAKRVFVLTRRFPKDETYSITNQMRRSSRAVGSMIAEAWGRRRYRAAFINKIDEALAECMETQAWLDYALDCEYIATLEHATLDAAWQHIGAMLQRKIDRAEDFCKSARPR